MANVKFVNVVKDNTTTQLLAAGFQSISSLSRRFAGQNVTVIETTDRSLPAGFALADFMLTNTSIVIRPTADRYMYSMSSDALAPGSGFYPDVPHFTADGITNALITIQKVDGDGVDMTNSTDSESLAILTHVGTTSGSILSLSLSSGFMETNITSPTIFQIGDVKVKDATNDARLGDYKIWSS